jgi:hypothetical protein
MTVASSKSDATRARSTASPGRFARGIRATLWLLIAVAACYVVFGYSRLWTQWREIPSSDESAAENFDPATLASSLPHEGPWSFARLDWDIRSQIVLPAEVAERFEKLSTSTTANDKQLPDVSPELFELAESLSAQSTENTSNRVFQLERPNLKARLVTRTLAGKAKVVALAVALPLSAERWQFFELSPLKSTTAGPIATSPQLLPLPPEARRDGGRFADDGRALLELVSLDSTSAELIALWKTAGWDVRSSGVADGSQFSYLCVRSGEVIYAWSADPNDELKNLMLVRTPDGPDTNSSDRPLLPQPTQE